MTKQQIINKINYANGYPDDRYILKWKDESTLEITGDKDDESYIYLIANNQPYKIPKTTIDLSGIAAGFRVYAYFNNIQSRYSFLYFKAVDLSDTVSNYGSYYKEMFFPHGNKENLIINGGMDVWQRGTSFATMANNTFASDRYKYLKSGAMVHTLSQDTEVPSNNNFYYSLKVDCTTVDSSIAASDYCMVRYSMEGYDFRKIYKKKSTLSFWVQSTKTGTFCVSFQNNAGNYSYIMEQTIDTANVWEYKVIEIDFNEIAGTWEFTNSIGLKINIVLTCGSTYQSTANSWLSGTYFSTSNQSNFCDSTDNNFWITGVQLIESDIPYPFIFRDITKEIELCQRYYEKSYNLSVNPGTSSNIGLICYNLEAASQYLRSMQRIFKTRKRNTPVMVWYSNDGTINKVNVNGTNRTVSDTLLEGENSSGCPQLDGSYGAAGNWAAAHWTADAEYY